MMNHHLKFPNDEQQLEKMMTMYTVAVPLNNEGVKLAESGRHREAIDKFLQAIAIKIDAVGEVSVEVCISLSGLADAYYGLGDYDNAYKKARRMLDIAKAIDSAEQNRIACEILRDISSKTKKVLLPDEHARPLSSKYSIPHSPQVPGISIEPPTNRCHNFAILCSNIENLKFCARCKKVKYCSVQCQKVSKVFHTH